MVHLPVPYSHRHTRGGGYPGAGSLPLTRTEQLLARRLWWKDGREWYISRCRTATVIPAEMGIQGRGVFLSPGPNSYWPAVVAEGRPRVVHLPVPYSHRHTRGGGYPEAGSLPLTRTEQLLARRLWRKGDREWYISRCRTATVIPAEAGYPGAGSLPLTRTEQLLARRLWRKGDREWYISRCRTSTVIPAEAGIQGRGVFLSPGLSSYSRGGCGARAAASGTSPGAVQPPSYPRRRVSRGGESSSHQEPPCKGIPPGAAGGGYPGAGSLPLTRTEQLLARRLWRKGDREWYISRCRTSTSYPRRRVSRGGESSSHQDRTVTRGGCGARTTASGTFGLLRAVAAPVPHPVRGGDHVHPVAFGGGLSRAARGGHRR